VIIPATGRANVRGLAAANDDPVAGAGGGVADAPDALAGTRRGEATTATRANRCAKEVT